VTSDEGSSDIVGSDSGDGGSSIYSGSSQSDNSALEGSEDEGTLNSDDTADETYKPVQSFQGLHVGMPFGAGNVSEIFPAIDRFTVAVVSSGTTEILHHSISRDARQMIEGDTFSHEDLDLMARLSYVDPHASHRGLPYNTNGEVRNLQAVSVRHARLVIDSQLNA